MVDVTAYGLNLDNQLLQAVSQDLGPHGIRRGLHRLRLETRQGHCRQIHDGLRIQLRAEPGLTLVVLETSWCDAAGGCQLPFQVIEPLLDVVVEIVRHRFTRST